MSVEQSVQHAQQARGLLSVQWHGILRRYREFLSALAFFVVMMAVFVGANPGVWLRGQIWHAVFIVLPIYITLAVAQVFVIVSGEIDLSFPSIVGVAGLIFALLTTAGLSPFFALGAALLTGVVLGAINALLITYLGLSSLVTTLGMMFFWRGAILAYTRGYDVSLTDLQGTVFHTLFAGSTLGIPNQLFWALLFAVISLVLFNYHVFGQHVRFVGDNPDAARELGIDVQRIRAAVFIYSGLAAGFIGVLASTTNGTYWPTLGQDYLLVALAAVFVGGTPTFGGVGSVAGAFVGACTVGLIESGLIAAGLTGYWTQLVYGIVVVISLVTHRLGRGKQAKGRHW